MNTSYPAQHKNSRLFSRKSKGGSNPEESCTLTIYPGHRCPLDLSTRYVRRAPKSIEDDHSSFDRVRSSSTLARMNGPTPLKSLDTISSLI
jgi:hypothetical protein